MRITQLVGKVLTPREQLPRSLVRLAGGTIVGVEPWGDRPAPADTLDVGEGWIGPGFIDLQINGAYGEDFSCADADVAGVAERLLAHGVTGFLPTLISLHPTRYPGCLDNLSRPLGRGARVLGVHLEGPYLNPRYRGAHAEEHLRPPHRAEMEALLAARPVRLVTLAPELPGALQMIDCLASQSVVVSLGHSGATYAQTLAALDAGASVGTHLFNAMSPLHHREPGMAGALLSDARPTVGVIADGLHLHPAALRLAYLALGPGRVCLVTDAMGGAGMPPGAYALGEHRVIVDDASARLEDGTLAGSVLSMDRAVGTMLQMAGCSLVEAVEMASLTPARVLGLDRHKGCVASGYDADLVVLSPDLEVEATLVGGAVVYRAGPAARLNSGFRRNDEGGW